MNKVTLLLTVLMLAGCAGDGPGITGGGNSAPDAEKPNPNETKPATDGEGNAAETDSGNDAAERTPEAPVTTAPPPAEDARTVEEFDTTTPEERAEAAAPAPAPTPTPDAAGDGRLGTTVASIGAADEPGFWIKTPLVSEGASGRLFYPASGRTVQVQLIPSGGSSGSGSQVSLAALRLLDAPLDGLPELVVYRN